MKGFLNKVQSKVSGGPSTPQNGAPVASGMPTKQSGEGKAIVPASDPSVLSSNKGVESTPRADISLPRKHDRR